jgi:hypothetical protein
MLLLYRSASRSGGCYYEKPVTEEMNVAIVEKEAEAQQGQQQYLTMNNDEFMMPPDYLVSTMSAWPRSSFYLFFTVLFCACICVRFRLRFHVHARFTF